MSPPGDPPDERDDPPPRPLMGPAFWVMLVFGLLCVLAGLGVAMLAPRLFPPEAPAPQADTSASHPGGP